jgi:WD40 repeat protein
MEVISIEKKATVNRAGLCKRQFSVRLTQLAGALLALALNLAPALVIQAQADTFTTTGSMATTRQFHTATLLPSGKVLVAGGGGSSGSLSSAELYDPATGTFTTTGAMATARRYHSATLLPSGQVLVTGGYDGSSSLSSAELYDPATGTFTTTGTMATARRYHTATLLPSGQVLVAGGVVRVSLAAPSSTTRPPALSLPPAPWPRHVRITQPCCSRAARSSSPGGVIRVT